MFSPNDRNRITPKFFSKEWAQDSYSRYETQYALQVVADWIAICTEYPPHPEVWQALDYLENKDSKTFQAVRNFRKCIYSPQESREQALRNLHALISQQFGQ